MVPAVVVALALLLGFSACSTEAPPAPPVAAEAVPECLRVAPFVERFAGIAGVRHVTFTDGLLARIVHVLNYRLPHSAKRLDADRLDLWRVAHEERAIFSLRGCVVFSELDQSGEFKLTAFVRFALGPSA